MNKFKKSQVVVLFVLVPLLAITPLLPSSQRPTYLYFISNFIIITLGAEAGLLSVFSRPLEERKIQSAASVIHPEASSEKREGSTTPGVSAAVSEQVEKKLKAVENSASHERVVSVTRVDNKVQKCPSRPNLFFIGGGEADDAEIMDEEEFEAEEEIGGVNGQELFAKAEAFIRNFYKQLNMQREESWIYQKAS